MCFICCLPDLTITAATDRARAAEAVNRETKQLNPELVATHQLSKQFCIINGKEQPVAYASRTLNDAEKNYAQIEREALALIFDVKKFNQYLYG